MKAVVSVCLFLLMFQCSSDDNSVDEPVHNVSLKVMPSATNANYPSTDNSHYVVRNSRIHVNKLLVFIGGSNSIPDSYNLFCDHAATTGFDVISISYPNTVAAAPLGTSADKEIFDHYRDEIAFGHPVSDVVNVDSLNSIVTRTIALLIYLHEKYPQENWKQYLNTAGMLNWNKIAVAGHSQGSGHACYLAKKNAVDRVLMFSGPNDYSTYYKDAAPWLRQSGATLLDKHFALLHAKDEIVPFSFQVSNLIALGMFGSAELPFAINAQTPDYRNAMSVDIPAISNHNSTVGGNAMLPRVWTFMLTK